MARLQPKRLGRKSHRRLNDLLLCAREGLSDQLRWTLRDHKIPVNSESAAGLTALFYAVRGQRYGITRYLIDEGGDVNAPLLRQPSLLEIADGLHDAKMVRILTDAGALPKPPERLLQERKTLPSWPTMIDFKNTEYPLYEAAISGDQSAFADLAAKLSQTRLQRLLIEACIEHEVELGKASIQCIKNVDFAREEVGNAICAAAGAGCLPLVHALRDAGAKKYLDVALLEAAQGGHADVVADLVEPAMTVVRKRLRRQDPEAREAFQSTLDGNARTAAQHGYTRVAEILLPYCSGRAAPSVTRGIERWRATQDFDAPPDRFASYRGEEETSGEALVEDPGDFWMDDGSVQGIVNLAADHLAPLDDRLAALKTLQELGPNAESHLATLNGLTRDPEKRIRRAVQQALQAIRN